MNPDQITNLASPLSQTVFGIVCLGLAWGLLKLWAEMKARDAAWEIKLAAKDALIYEQYEKRLANNAILIEALTANNRAMASMASAGITKVTT